MRVRMMDRSERVGGDMSCVALRVTCLDRKERVMPLDLVIGTS